MKEDPQRRPGQISRLWLLPILLIILGMLGVNDDVIAFLEWLVDEWPQLRPMLEWVRNLRGRRK